MKGGRLHHDRDLDQLCRRAVAQGWRYETLSNGHFRLLPPDRTRPAVVLAGSSSDQRALRNAISLLRRSGLDV